MDEMNIISKFMTGIVSKIVTKILKDKLGYRIPIQINEIKVKIDEGGQAHIRLNVEADIDKSELIKIINSKWD